VDGCVHLSVKVVLVVVGGRGRGVKVGKDSVEVVVNGDGHIGFANAGREHNAQGRQNKTRHEKGLILLIILKSIHSREASESI
jgi:hypothetical protein